jgi:hypothetical protein
MSFRCDICDGVQPVDSSPVRVILETRRKIYPRRTKRKKKPPFEEIVIDRGGEGTEIVEEANACPECAVRFQ